MSRRTALVDLACVLLLVLAASAAIAVFGGWLVARVDLPAVYLLVAQGMLVLVGLRALLYWRGQDWTSVGLRRFAPGDLGRGLYALMLVFVTNLLVMLILHGLAPSVVEGHQDRLAGVGRIFLNGVPFVAAAAAMLFVGLYEEILARGFLLARCRTLVGGRWLPVLLSSLLFGIGHFYQGWLGVMQTALIGVVFAWLALRWGTLWPLILAHGALNTVTLFLVRPAG